MSKTILVPYRLQEGTNWDSAKNFINENFYQLASSFTGFGSENQITFPDNTLSYAGLAAGGLLNIATTAYTTTTQDDMLFIIPTVSLYVDPPPAPLGSTSYDNNYLYPTGSLLTTGQQKLTISVWTCMSSRPGITSTGFRGSDGNFYYYANDIVIQLRNLDTVSHNYYFTVDQTLYTRTNSIYH